MSNITKAIAVLGVVAGLGVASLPLSSYAAGQSVKSGDVTVQTTVNSEIGIITSTDLVNMPTVTSGAEPATGSVDVTVTTNKATYSLVVNDKDADTNMNRVADGTTPAEGKVTAIPTGTPAKGSLAWGVKNELGAWAPVPASSAAGLALVTDKAGNGDGATTTVTFGVSVDGTVADGTYNDVVVFTATASE